ncbi:MAG: DsbA family protein [Rhodospirillales bacterium]
MTMTFRFAALPGVSLIAALALGAVLVTPTAQAQDKAPAMDPQQRGAIEGIVREYLLANPEVIVDAIRLYREREQQAQAEQAKMALTAHKDSLTNDPHAPVAGNPKGDVTVVEFFDYQCGYCKRVFPVLRELLDSDKNLRWVFKEFPILGPESVSASRAALAAWNLDPAKYLAFHAALMAANGGLPEDRILKIAKSAGYDTGKLKKEMDSDAVTAEINRNHQIAETLGIRGTPAFIIGDELVPGAVDVDTLRQLIAKARKG